MENLEDIEIGTSVESFQKLLNSQKELFHCQIDQLQRIVVTQCKLTGVNPLSQEMAAGAMSIKIGKRPRDLMNPKAVKYMQAVFSMKDAISKKESREISVQFGVTVTQVRDFFTSQRSRVRKLVRLSQEKAARANGHEVPQDGVTGSSDPMMPIDLAPLNSVHPDSVPSTSVASSHAHLNSVGSVPEHTHSVGSIPACLNSVSSNPVPLMSGCSNPSPSISGGFNAAPSISPVSYPSPSISPVSYPSPLISVGANSTPVNSVGSNPALINSIDTASTPANLVCPSYTEEGPSCSSQDEMLPSLPDFDKHFVENIFSSLRKEETFSGQVKLMEWILQIQNPTVLNWFLSKGGVMILATWLSQAAAEEQTSVLLVTLKDIRARVLLSRWSKMFARAQATKKPNGTKFSMDAQDMILKQSINEIMGNELWQPNVTNPENVLALSESSDNIGKTEPSQVLKLLPASAADDSSRKHILGVSSSHNRERRKVQLVEQPGQKTGGRSPQAAKASSASQSRPMSTDDIQKAKMRALFMQSKYGKTGSSSNGSNGMKTGLSKPASTPSSSLSPASKVPPLPKSKIEENKQPVIAQKNSYEGPLDQKQKMDLKVPLEDLCKMVQIPWQTPPEMKLDDIWRVGTGENSKEVDVQKNRNRREVETIYRTIQAIPANPKEPWDIEMDYDDTLTPEIPIEQPPEAEVAETQVSLSENIVKTAVTSRLSIPQINGGSAAEPDLELLAVLLKNPELVFALTSGQAGNISPEDTVKLLDMIKRTGAGLADGVNGYSGKVEEKIEVSLPSPTPSSTPGTAGWRPEVAKNPFSVSQQSARGKSVVDSNPHIPSMQHQNQNHTIPQQQAAAVSQLLSQQVQSSIPSFPLSQTTSSSIIHENRQPSVILPSHQNLPINSSLSQTQYSEIGLATKILPMNTPPLQNLSTTTGPAMRVETGNYAKPAQPVSFALNTPDRRSASFPGEASTRSHSQTHLLSEPAHVHPSRPSTGNMGSMPESWRSRQTLASNSLSQINQTNYDASSYRGPGQPQARSGPPWGRNEYMVNDGFESWSPENSPRGSPEYMRGNNYISRTNPGWNYNPENRASQRNYNSGQQDQTRNDGNRRWR